MIEYLVLFLAIPLGVFLFRLTEDEKEIYSRWPYFKLIIPALFVLSLVFYFRDNQVFFTLAFMVIMMISWIKG